jgi:hypothetical protein
LFQPRGIGSLGDAIATGLILRHPDNDLYLKALDRFGIKDTSPFPGI